MAAYRQQAWFGGKSFSESASYGLKAVFAAREEKEIMQLETAGVMRIADSTSMALLCAEK